MTLTWNRPSLAVIALSLVPACLFSPPDTLDTDSGSTGSSSTAVATDESSDGPGDTADVGTDTGPGADSTTTTTTTGPDDTTTGGPPGVCGDGQISGTEACDDGNTAAGDGCDESCEEELGYNCMGQPSVCESICGDGVVSSDEACDDDNTEDGDGCTACMVDPGFQCLGAMPSVCSAVCGDGLRVGNEGCDDGDMIDGNGCASDCAVEMYFRCQGEGPGSCAPIRILYLVADDDEVVFRDSISMVTNGPTDYADARSTTPTLAMLESSYDCVFTHPNFSYADSLGTGAVLASFVDGGANVVLGIATDYAPPTGLSGSTIMMPAYSPVSTAGQVAFAAGTYAGDGTSAIHTGVMTYGNTLYDTMVVLQGMGVQDATLDSGEIAVAYRPDFKVVYLNGTGHSALGGTGDWPLLIANACAVGYL